MKAVWVGVAGMMEPSLSRWRMVSNQSFCSEVSESSILKGERGCCT